MTAQISDIVRHKRHKYSVVALTDEIGFNPEDYGLHPQMRSTACWRGYWCEYNADETMTLQRLYIFNGDNDYPDIQGTKVSRRSYQLCDAWWMENGKQMQGKKKFERHMGHRLYNNLNLKIEYSGKILLGDGFIQDYYIHMGFQRSWAYQKLIELVFKNGELIKKNDHSKMARELRERMEKQGEDPLRPEGDNIPLFVDKSFSLEYQDKAWWL